MRHVLLDTDKNRKNLNFILTFYFKQRFLDSTIFKHRKGQQKVAFAIDARQRKFDHPTLVALFLKFIIQEIREREKKGFNNLFLTHQIDDREVTIDRTCAKSVQSRRVNVGELSGLIRQSWEQGPLKLLSPRGRWLLLLLAEASLAVKCICTVVVEHQHETNRWIKAIQACNRSYAGKTNWNKQIISS